MSRRPWLGLGLSVALHVGIVALMLLVLSSEDVLPALMVDLRDAFVPGSASVRSAAPEARRARSASASRSRKATPEVTPVPRPAPEPSGAPAAPPPAPTVEAPPAPPALSPAPTSEPPASAGGSGVASGGTAGGGLGPGASGLTGGSPSGVEHGAGERGEGTGSPGPLVASVPSGRGSGVGAEYGPYLAALRQRIQQSVRYPPSARRRGIAGTVRVEILILANGTVGDVTLLESSTHAILDEAALDTIRSLPRMPLPPDLPARPLRVRVPVVFEMR